MKERKKDAQDAVNLMREATLRKLELEESKNGLVIIQALYGKLGAPDVVSVRMLSPQGIKDLAALAKNRLQKALSQTDNLVNTEASPEYIDVTLSVQSMVNNSQLHISGGSSKASLIGFYDPCLGEKKYLRVTYQFQGKMHQVQVDDKTALAAPLRGNSYSCSSHCVKIAET